MRTLAIIGGLIAFVLIINDSVQGVRARRANAKRLEQLKAAVMEMDQRYQGHLAKTRADFEVLAGMIREFLKATAPEETSEAPTNV